MSICTNPCQNMKKHEVECNLLHKLKLSKSEEKNSLPLTTLSCLTPLRSLLLNDEDQEVVRYLKSHQGSQHGREIGFLTEHMGMQIAEDEKQFLIFVCSVLDANAFEVVTGCEQDQTSLRGEYKKHFFVKVLQFPFALQLFLILF